MKLIIRENKSNGEMHVEYAKVVKQPYFRYCLLTKILASIRQDITLFIDTNQCIDTKPVEQVEAFLQQMQIHYCSMRAESNPRQFFGFAIAKNKKGPLREHKIVLEMPENTFSRELYEVIQGYDLSFGFGRKKTFEELCMDYKQDNASVVFNPESFQESLYDSIICECLRSSFNVEQFAREAENEVTI